MQQYIIMYSTVHLNHADKKNHCYIVFYGIRDRGGERGRERGGGGEDREKEAEN